MSGYTALILAAGKGTRMKSELPKVMHRVAGETLVSHVTTTALEAGAEQCVVVVGHGFDLVVKELEQKNVDVVIQHEQLGTGHAVMVAEDNLPDEGDVVVLCGDTPLLTASTIINLRGQHAATGAAVTILTTELDNPFGYGRIVRGGDGRISKIVEEKDATEAEKTVCEINSGVYCFAAKPLKRALQELTCDNAQMEYYLTDVIPAIIRDGGEVGSYMTRDSSEILGINDRVQLALAEGIMRRRITEELMRSGVTIIDPALTFIHRLAKIGKDTIIYPGVTIEGASVIGRACVLRGSSRIMDCHIGDDCELEASVLLSSQIGDGVKIGPYAYVRPGSHIGNHVKIGDYVEIKNSRIGNGSKVPHLSYVGDADVGEGVNIGAGTITCNYDGVKKHRTIIGDNSFIGSNSSLIAPLVVGENSYIGAGSAISKDVPSGALAVTRNPQRTLENYHNRSKK
jgi:bifunctional UDP-N-acetylglucosamine pyrophosphorylase/glucosamine-1-phosphate N-acetyltransferase